MSAALSTQPDHAGSENFTLLNGTHPNISLGSLTTGSSAPSRNIRAPSSSSHNRDEETQDEGGDLLITPAVDKKRWGDGPETPVATRLKKTRASIGATIGGTKGSALTLRDQEKVGGLPFCIVLF